MNRVLFSKSRTFNKEFVEYYRYCRENHIAAVTVSLSYPYKYAVVEWNTDTAYNYFYHGDEKEQKEWTDKIFGILNPGNLWNGWSKRGQICGGGLGSGVAIGVPVVGVFLKVAEIAEFLDHNIREISFLDPD